MYVGHVVPVNTYHGIIHDFSLSALHTGSITNRLPVNNMKVETRASPMQPKLGKLVLHCMT